MGEREERQADNEVQRGEEALESARQIRRYTTSARAELDEHLHGRRADSGPAEVSGTVRRIAEKLDEAARRNAAIEKQLAAAYAELHAITETLGQARTELGRLTEGA